MKGKKRKEMRKQLMLLSFLFLIIITFFLFLIKRSITTGKAIEQSSEIFVENLDSSSLKWQASNVNHRTIYEEHLDKELKGFDIISSSNIEVPLPQTGISPLDDEGIIWMRIKLDNTNYAQEEFLPFMLTGKMLLFKGNVINGAIQNGKDIFIGAPGYYQKIDTLDRWSKDEWHELMIYWNKGFDDPDCSTGKTGAIIIWIDGQLIPATIDCTERCDEYTASICHEYFPFTNKDSIILMPSSLQLASFSMLNTERKSGFFIDKLAVSKLSTKDFLKNWGEESISEIKPYWSGINNQISIPKNSGEMVIIDKINEKCKIWNSNEIGTISISKDYIEGFDLEVKDNNLRIKSVKPDLETRKSFDIICGVGNSEAKESITLTIGEPQIFEFFFKDNNKNEISIILEKNSNKIIEYSVKNIERDSTSLDHVVTGNSLAQTEFLEKSMGYHRLKISSGSTHGEETLTLTITNSNTEEAVVGTIRVTVLADNHPPEIYSYSPKESIIEIEKGNSVTFTQESRDDRTTSLIFKWYENNTILKGTSQSYQFSTNYNTPLGMNTIKLEVSDGSLKTEKTWTLIVKEKTQQNYSVMPNTSGYKPKSTVCGNNITELGEACDGTDNSGCKGYTCLNNCSCYLPAQSNLCLPDWRCTNWSICQPTINIKTRLCSDINNCKVTTEKPYEIEICQPDQQTRPTPSGQCVSNWTCTNWSLCSNGKMTRDCIDRDNCGSNLMPAETSVCQDIQQNAQGASTTEGINSGFIQTDSTQTGQEASSSQVIEGTQTGEEVSSSQVTDNIQTGQEAFSSQTEISQPSTQGEYYQQEAALTGTEKNVKQAERSTAKTIKTPQAQDSRIKDSRKSPATEPTAEDRLFKALLWIFLALCVVPFIIIGAAKLSKAKPEKTNSPPIQTTQTTQYPFNYDKLAETIQWYKAKGMSPNSAYQMLLRMGFDDKHARDIIYNTFFNKK